MPAPSNPTATAPAAAYQHGTYGSQEKTIPQLANPKLQGGPTVCATTAGMEEETPPPQMPYLFIALASRMGWGKLARHPPPRPPSWGDTGALPSFNPCILGWYFTWQMAASLLRTKPRELYSDTRELAREETQLSGCLQLATKRLHAGGFGTEKGRCGAHFLCERGTGASDPDDLQQSQFEANPKNHEKMYVHAQAPRT